MWHFNFADLPFPELYSLRSRGCKFLSERDLKILRCVTYHYHLGSEEHWLHREQEALDYIAVQRPNLKRPRFQSLGDSPSPDRDSEDCLSEESRSPK